MLARKAAPHARRHGVWIAILIGLIVLLLVALPISPFNPEGETNEKAVPLEHQLAIELLPRFAPILRLARGEHFIPIGRKRYLTVSELITESGRGANKQVTPLVTPDEAQLPEGTPPDCAQPCRIFLALRKPAGRVRHPYRLLEQRLEATNAMPLVQTHANKLVAADGKPSDPASEITLQYWFLYLFNDFPADNHESDWEQVTIRLNPAGEAQQIFLSTHANGQRLAWEQIRKHGSHPIVYVGLGSHANFSHWKTHPVLLGCSKRRRLCISIAGGLRVRPLSDVSGGCGDTLIPADISDTAELASDSGRCRQSGQLRTYTTTRLARPRYIGGYSRRLFSDPTHRAAWTNPIKWMERAPLGASESLLLGGHPVQSLGALAFGAVLGWSLYFTLRHSRKHAIEDLGLIASALGGAALVKLFPDDLFGWYCLGVGVGFFGYFALGLAIALPQKKGQMFLFSGTPNAGTDDFRAAD